MKGETWFGEQRESAVFNQHLLKHTKIDRSNIDVNDLKIYINHALENGLILKREYNYISDIINST